MIQFLHSIVIVAAAGVLFSLCSLTQDIRHTVMANCRYKNGHWSARRVWREIRSYLRYISNMAVPFFLAVPAMFVALQYLNDQIPFSMGMKIIESVDPDPQILRNNLEKVQKEHAQLLSKNRGLSGDRIDSIQRNLWHQWPLIVGYLFCLTVAAIGLVIGGAKHAVMEYVQGIRRRRDYYRSKHVRWSSAEWGQNFVSSASNRDATGHP